MANNVDSKLSIAALKLLSTEVILHLALEALQQTNFIWQKAFHYAFVSPGNSSLNNDSSLRIFVFKCQLLIHRHLVLTLPKQKDRESSALHKL
jgi:hypothetical protein